MDTDNIEPIENELSANASQLDNIYTVLSMASQDAKLAKDVLDVGDGTELSEAEKQALQDAANRISEQSKQINEALASELNQLNDVITNTYAVEYEHLQDADDIRSIAESITAAHLESSYFTSIGLTGDNFLSLPVDEKIRIIRRLPLGTALGLTRYLIDTNAVKFKTRRQRAQDIGAYMDIDETQTVISDKDYMYALSALKNSQAYIALLNDDALNNLKFVNGELLFGYDEKELQSKMNEGIKKARDLDIPFLYSIFTVMYKDETNRDKSSIPVYLSALCDSMGISLRDDEKKGITLGQVINKIEEFSRCIGFTKDGFYKLLDWQGYDAKTNSLILASPYMHHIMQLIEAKSLKQGKDGKEYEKPAYCHLVKSTIVKERNKPAVAIVYKIATGLQQRGTRPDSKLPKNKDVAFEKYGKPNETDAQRAARIENNKRALKKVTYHISAKELIKTCPQLADALDRCKTNSSKDVVLKRAFSKVFELLKTQTKIYEYYSELDVADAIPTMTTLNTEIKITHYGRQE